MAAVSVGNTQTRFSTKPEFPLLSGGNDIKLPTLANQAGGGYIVIFATSTNPEPGCTIVTSDMVLAQLLLVNLIGGFS